SHSRSLSSLSLCVSLYIFLPLPVTSAPFFFHCYRAHRYLHSFPTRRSSDLFGSGSYCDHTSLDHAHLPTCACNIGYAYNAIAERSEEHTSELQSRFDLVCRLLLEKKKKY